MFSSRSPGNSSLKPHASARSLAQVQLSKFVNSPKIYPQYPFGLQEVLVVAHTTPSIGPKDKRHGKMNKFITEAELDEARKIRQAEWEKVRTEDQPLGT
jgi:hypothetical protein